VIDTPVWVLSLSSLFFEFSLRAQIPGTAPPPPYVKYSGLFLFFWFVNLPRGNGSWFRPFSMRIPFLCWPSASLGAHCFYCKLPFTLLPISLPVNFPPYLKPSQALTPHLNQFFSLLGVLSLFVLPGPGVCFSLRTFFLPSTPETLVYGLIDNVFFFTLDLFSFRAEGPLPLSFLSITFSLPLPPRFFL